METTTATVTAAASKTASSVPLTLIPGVRPLLLVVTFALSWLHLSWAQFELGRSVPIADCRLVGSFVAVVGGINAICCSTLMLVPWLHPEKRAAGCCLRALRFLVYGLAFACIPVCFVFGILGGLWVHVDNCWEHVYMRNLTVVDAIVMQMAALVALHYLWNNWSQQLGEWWDATRGNRCNWTRRCGWAACKIGRGGLRRIAFMILLLVTLGCGRSLSADHDLRSRTFHWVMSPRPAACAISCTELYRPLSREQLCMDGYGRQVSIRNCMDDLNPNDKFPQGHENLHPCIPLQCTSSDGSPVRYHWSLRAEHLFDVSDCSKHDRRIRREVSLLQEYGCFDEHTQNWVDEAPYCITERTQAEWNARRGQHAHDPNKPPTDDPSIIGLFVDPALDHAFDSGYRFSPESFPSQPLPPITVFPQTAAERSHGTYYELFWRDRQCALMCSTGMERQWNHFMVQIAVIASMLLRLWMGGDAAASTGSAACTLHHTSKRKSGGLSGEHAPLLASSSSSSSSSSFSPASSSSSPSSCSSLSSPSAASSSSSSLPLDLRFLRHQLASSNAHSWLLVRLARTLVAVHGPGGLRLLAFPARLAVHVCVLCAWVWIVLESFRDALWMSDTHCRSTVVQSTLNDSVVFLSVVAGVAWAVERGQRWAAAWDPVASARRETHDERSNDRAA